MLDLTLKICEISKIIGYLSLIYPTGTNFLNMVLNEGRDYMQCGK